MKTLGKFEILEKVGQGAMGVVYKARDPLIGRLVALKTITTGLADDPALLQRFYQEARSAGALEHPNIVTIYELGKEGDTPFIAMQFLEGESLDKVLERRSSLPLSQRISFIVYVCRALEYAHKRGVIHRDIKPGNVMVTADGSVKVVDFGIARLGDTGKTQTGLMIGTLGYMSPHQFRNVPADARSDIWAVGIMFYEILAGRRPFVGDNSSTLMMNIMMQELPSIIDAAPGTPQEVAAVIERMLKKEIEERFQSMEEVLIELEPVWKRLQQEEVSGLVQNGEALLKAGNLAGARDVLIKACKLDITYTQARILLEQVNSEIKRSQILPQAKKRVEKSQSLLAVGRFEEARAEAEAALQLDSTFQPAREMLAKVQVAADRARDVALAVRTAKQCLAEGAITEAELQLTKVLEIDATNAAAQDLLRQIREEKARRERERRLSETLHRARTLWTELRYDECIQLLLGAQQEFSGEAAISKLLETARQDQSEQVKQALLTEARNLVRAQQFDDVLTTLNRILEQFPSDPTAKNLRTLALQGREQQIRERQLKEDLANLRKLVKAEKYQEAIVRGEHLLQKFPKEFELAELVTYARSEHARNEQEGRLERWVEKVNRGIKEGCFQEAIQAAETALGEFPRNMDLMILLNRAKTQKEEKEKRELLDQRIKEIRNRVNREELTGAIDLARQTLVNLGPDTDISLLLHQSEVELQQREKKKREQQEKVLQARTLLDAGRLGDATMILQRAVETRIFSDSDPRLKDLLREIDEKQTPPPLVAPPSAPRPRAPGPVPGPASWTAPTGDPGKDYVYQQGVPLPDAPRTVEQDSATSVFSATSVTGPTIQPIPSPAPLKEKTPGKSGKSKPQQQIPGPISRGTATDTSPASLKAPPLPPPVRPLHGEPSAELQADAVVQLPPAALPLWKRALVIGGIGAVLALTIGLTAFIKLQAVRYATVISDTEEYIAQGSWDDAERALRGLPTSLPKYSQLKSQIDAGRRDDSDFNSRKTAIDRAENPKNEQELHTLLDYFNGVVGQRGRHSSEAQGVVARIGRDLRAIKPPPPNYEPAITAARGFISQSRWDDAEKALGGLPTSLPQFAQLKSQIDAGRHDDSDFNSRKTDVDRAENPKNAQELHTLLDYFNGVVGQRGRHSSEAQDLVARIGRDLKPPPPNFEPGIAAVRGFVNQSRWDDAEKALSGLPTSLPEYSQLKSQIDAGRSEDKEFNSRKNEIDPAISAKNDGALRALLGYFNGVANQGGWHSGEARGLVPGIDRSINIIVAGRQHPPPTTDDAADITAALNQYAAAIKNANMDGIRSTRQFRNTDDESKFANSIKAMRGQGYSLRNCTPPAIAGDTAKVSCDVALLANKDVKPARTTFTFSRANNHWVIVATN